MTRAERRRQARADRKSQAKANSGLYYFDPARREELRERLAFHDARLPVDTMTPQHVYLMLAYALMNDWIDGPFEGQVRFEYGDEDEYDKMIVPEDEAFDDEAFGFVQAMAEEDQRVYRIRNLPTEVVEARLSSWGLA